MAMNPSTVPANSKKNLTSLTPLVLGWKRLRKTASKVSLVGRRPSRVREGPWRRRLLAIGELPCFCYS